MIIRTRLYLFTFIIGIGCHTSASLPYKETFTVHENSVSDSFGVYIDSFRHGGKGYFDKIVFYFDANLKSGKKIRKFFIDSFNKNTLLIGIAHYGNYREKRRKDFMAVNPAIISLLDSTIIPKIKAEYGWSRNRIIIGHSFAGLWAYRNFLKGDSTFTTTIAISPSLWYQKQYETPLNTPKGDNNLYIYWGGNERLNYIRNACRSLEVNAPKELSLKKRILFKEIKGKGHHSTVTSALFNYFSIQ